MTVAIIASEGGAGYYPENTAYAVRQSLASNVDGCELDFHLTADNVFVAHHDYLLNRALTRDQNGEWLPKPGPAINKTSSSELRLFDVGAHNPESKIAHRYPDRTSRTNERVPTFQEIENAFFDHPEAELWFEAKTDPFNQAHTTPADVYVAALTKQLLPSALFTRTVLIAFDWHLLEIAQLQMPGIQTGFLTVDFSWLTNDTAMSPNHENLDKWFGGFPPSKYDDHIPRAVKAAGGTYWSPYFRDLSQAAVDEAHDLGLKVSTWGADKSKDIERALDMGVDSLTTGYVDRAKHG